MLSKLLLPGVLICYVVQHSLAVLCQLIPPKLVGVDFVPVVHRHVLLQGLLPAVRLVTEGALELLRNSTCREVAVGTFHVSLAHLLLQVLLEAGLVGEFATAVRTFQRSVNSVVSRLEVIVQEALLREVLVAVDADKRSLSGVNPIVDVQVGLPRVRLLADCAYKWFLA